MKDPTYDEMREYLKHTMGIHDEYDEFDVAEAIHQYAVAYHGGQWTNLYAAIELCGFRPGAYYAGLKENSSALEIYTLLCDHFGEILR